MEAVRVETKEGGRLCIGIVDDIVVNNASKCTTRSGWRGGVLSWEGYWAALLALSVELLLVEESERRLVGRWPCLGGNSRLGLPQLGLHREKLVLEGGTRGRGALGYGRAARARGNHNW